MKIGFVSDSYPLGGIAKVVSLIGSSLENEGYSSFYLAVSGVDSNFYQIPKSKLIIANNKPRYFNKYASKLKIFINSKLNGGNVDLGKYRIDELSNIKKFIENKNLDTIVICRYDLTFLVSKIKESFPNLKIIVWIHGPVELYTKKKERLKYLKYYLDNLHLCDEVICLTSFDLLELERFKIIGTKIYNPVEHTINQNILCHSRDKTILCVSRLDIKDKGIDKLVTLANALPDIWKIQLIGSGNAKEEKALKRLLEKLERSDKFEFLGSKSSDELSTFYKKAAIYVSPAMYEGFGMTVAEAMCFALPVVCFQTTGAREITEDGKYGILIKDFEESGFVNEVLSLIDNELKLKELSSLALNKSKDFSLEKIITSWKAILEIS